MKILVTGSGGFLGGHLCRALRAQRHEVTTFRSRECDLRRADALARFNHAQYDQIYHLAAWTQAGDWCLTHPGEQWIENHQINTNVLAWWQTQQPQAKLIALGSSCCYEPGQPHREDQFLTARPIESLFTYAQTKRMLYVGLEALRKQYGLRYLFGIPSTLYGPDYHLDGRQMHFIFDLMRKIVDGKEHGTPVVLWGDGSQKRELTHVGDFASALMQLAERCDNEIVNIGSGVEYSIRHYAEELCAIVGTDPRSIQYDTSRYVGAPSKVLRVDKLQQLLPDAPRRELRKGLEEIIDWYQRQPRPKDLTS